jgi:hypothetical protein
MLTYLGFGFLQMELVLVFGCKFWSWFSFGTEAVVKQEILVSKQLGLE